MASLRAAPVRADEPPHVPLLKGLVFVPPAAFQPGGAVPGQAAVDVSRVPDVEDPGFIGEAGGLIGKPIDLARRNGLIPAARSR